MSDLIRRGPAVGMHLMIWADTYANAVRWLSSSLLREFDSRIAFRMNQTDSSSLIDTPAAAMLGHRPWSVFWRIELPLAWPGLLAGMALTVAHTLGEFGVVLMVGGNIEGETRTLSVSLYDKVQGMDLQSAHVMALALVGVSLLALSLVLAFDRVGQRGRALQER